MSRIGKRRDVNHYIRILERYNITPERVPQMTNEELLNYPGIGNYGLHLLREKFGFDYTKISYEYRLRYRLEKALTSILGMHRNVGVKKIQFIAELVQILITEGKIGPKKAKFIAELMQLLIKTFN